MQMNFVNFQICTKMILLDTSDVLYDRYIDAPCFSYADADCV
jgi:hypothetical protein